MDHGKVYDSLSLHNVGFMRCLSFLNVVCYAVTFPLASFNHISIFLSVFCDACMPVT
jgi:hypothetical protein